MTAEAKIIDGLESFAAALENGDEPALDVPPRRSEQVEVTITQGGYRPPEINVEED